MNRPDRGLFARRGTSGLAAGGGGGPSHTRGRGLVIGICLVIAGLEGYAIQALGVAAPRMAPSLHMALQQVGYAASATMAAMGLGAIAGGWLADRFGRRRVMTISVVVFGLSTLLTAAAWSADALVLVRLATGLGLGGAMPNIIAVASEISTPERRARAVTTVSVGLPAGAATAALVTRVFSHGFDWRLIFVIGGILALLVSPAVALLLPEPARRDPAARFVDRRAIPALFFEGRWIATLLLWIAICLTMIVLSVMTNWLPTLMIAKGFSGDAGSLAALVFGVVGAGGGLALGRLIDRAGFAWPLAATFTALAVVTAALAAVSGLGPSMLLVGLAGFLVVGAQFAIYAMFPVYYPSPVRGTGAGAGVAAGRVGSIIGPTVAGILLERGASGDQVVQAMLPAVLGAGMAAVLVSVIGDPHRD